VDQPLKVLPLALEALEMQTITTAAQQQVKAQLLTQEAAAVAQIIQAHLALVALALSSLKYLTT
jgi:hypothetical protein